MKREFEAFLETPTPGSYLVAFQALLSGSQERLAGEEILELLALMQAGKHEALVASISRLPPLAALSPAVHWIAAESAQARGDAGDAELEHFLLTTCLAGILETGDGTPLAPYVVPCAADERYVCAARGLSPAAQSLVNRGGRAVDFVQCGDGTTVCFDVSGQVPLPALPARRKDTRARQGRSRRADACCTSGERQRLTRAPR